MQRQLIRGAACNRVNDTDAVVQRPIFLRAEWFSLLDRYVRNSDGMTRTMCLHDSTHTGAYLPVYEERSGGGRELHSLSNFYSPSFQLLGDRVLNAADHLAFVQKFKRYFACFDHIDLVPLLGDEARYWRDAFQQIGFRGFIYDYSSNWYHDGITGLDAFWQVRPTRLRNTIRKKTDKLYKDDGFIVDVVNPTSKLDLWRYLAHYHQVYFSSWKCAEPFPSFIDAIAEYAWSTGELRLGMAYHCDTPIASQIWFVCAKTAYIFKLAYRPEYSRHSIGTILSKKLFDHVIEKDGVTCIDYLTGNDPYKADWMNKCRKLYGIQLCNPRRIRGGVSVLQNTASRWSKRFWDGSILKSS